MSDFVTVAKNGIDPVADAPHRENVLAGSPRFRSWSVEEADGICAGLWEATPGKWRFENDAWEYCRILAGKSVIAEDGGTARTVQAGDSFVLRVGFKGTWEVIETTLKDYVIRT